LANLKYGLNISLDTPQIDLNFEGAKISYVFDNGDIEQADIFYSSDGSISFNNIYPNIDFNYTAYFSEFKEEITVHTPEALSQLKIKIHCDSCKIQKIEGQYYVCAQNDSVWKFMPLFAADSNGNEIDGISVRLEYQGSNDYVIYLSIDADWVAQAQFPIVIDPTISLVTYAETTLFYKDDIYSKITVPVRSPEPSINDDANTTNSVNAYINHSGITAEITDFALRNWSATVSGGWSKWMPIVDESPWQLDSTEGLKTIEAKYRTPESSPASPQEQYVGYVETIENYRWLERYRNSLGGEVLSVVGYGNDIYMGNKIPYGNDFVGSIWKFNGKYFEYIDKMQASVGNGIVNVYPFAMKAIGSSIYIAAGRDDNTEGAGVVFRYNESNGLILAST